MKGLFQTEYVVRNNRPIIYLFRRENRKKIVEEITTYRPYFYVSQNELIIDKSKILRIEDTEIRAFMTGERVKKVTAYTPYDIYDLRKQMSKTYEADIPFTLRYLIDNVEENVVQEYRIMYLDIETTVGTSFPNPQNPYQNITTISFYDNYSEEMITLAWRKDLKNEKVKVKDGYIYYFSNEREMLIFFIKAVIAIDPDIITAWNIKFDLGYLIARMGLLKLDTTKLSPLGQVKIYQPWNSDDAYGDVAIRGRVVFDLMVGYMNINLTGLTSYSLDAVCEKELGTKKIVVWDYDKVWLEDLSKLIEYNRYDVELMIKLDRQMDIIYYYEEMKNLSCMDNIDSCKWYSRVLDTLILRKYKNQIVFPTKGQYIKQDEPTIEGAFVHEPKNGLWEDIIVFDFKALYPKIIQTFNLSKECIVEEDDGGDYIRINGICLRKDIVGILPSVVQDLFDLRDVYEKNRDKNEPGTWEYNIWNRKDFACKFLVNALYGINVLTSFRIYDPRIASTITFVGRELNKWATKIVTDLGYKVVYGDTDSIFVHIPKEKLDGNDIIQIGKEVENVINKSLSDYCKQYKFKEHELKMIFEKYYTSMLIPVRKKKYAGWQKWKKGKWVDKIDIVGFEARRSDSTKLAVKVQESVLDMLLKKKEMDEIYTLIIDIGINIVQGKYKPSELAIPSKLEKLQYEMDLPRIRAKEWAKKTLGLNFVVGTKFLVLYTDEKQMGFDVMGFQFDEQIQHIKIKLNIDKNLDVNIFMKLNTIFESLGKLKEVELLKQKVYDRIAGQQYLGKYIC